MKWHWRILAPDIVSFKCIPINSKSGAMSPIQLHLTVLLILGHIMYYLSGLHAV